MQRGDTIGISVAAAGHVLLITVLALGLLNPAPVKPPRQDAIDVSLVDSVALENMTRQRSAPAAAQAPEEGPVEEAAPAPPQERVMAEPQPAPRPEPKPEPKAEPKPAPPKKPQPRPAPKVAAVAPSAKPVAPPKPAGKGKAVAARAPRLDLKYLEGADSDSPAAARGAPAKLGDSQVRALNQEISRQLKPHWRAPSGADADQLVTILRWRLNADGTLASGPELADQTGHTDTNRPQQQLHVEAAIRAVRAAAPFKLPPEYYDYWKNIVSFRFDKRL